MPILTISDELQVVIDKAVREEEYADDVEYITRLVRQDQKRRAKEQIFASIASEGEASGDSVEALAESLRGLRMERHRHFDEE